MTYDYGGSVIHPYLGQIMLKKIAGSGAVTVGTQINIPHAAAMPRNPVNNSYYTGINSSAYTSGNNEGKRTPSVTITTVAQASWFTAANINSLIMTLDSYGNTDTWGIGLYDGNTTRVYDGAKCAQIQIRQQATGGPISVSIAFLCQYGDSQNPQTLYTQTSFTPPSVPPAGQVFDLTQVGWTTTANLIQSFALNIVRPQGYVMYDDGTFFAAGIASGMFGGDLTVTQSVLNTEYISSGFTLNIGAVGTSGISCAGLTLLDEAVTDVTMSPEMIVSQYSLYDQSAGGNPFVITSPA